MTESDGQQSPANGHQATDEMSAPQAEPVVSKPYIMPDDPEPNEIEALTKDAADARDRMLRRCRVRDKMVRLDLGTVRAVGQV